MHALQRNSQHSQQKTVAVLSSELSTQRSHLSTLRLFNFISYSADLASYSFLRSLSRPVIPLSGKEVSFSHVGHFKVAACDSLFSMFFRRHLQQKECRQDSIRGSVYSSEQMPQWAVVDKDTALNSIIFPH